jgi:hypothetical protein
VEATSQRPVFLGDARRSFRLLHPGVQLGLALHVLAVGCIFGLLFFWNAWYAFADLVAAGLAGAPAALETQLREQARSFALVSLAMGLGYALLVVGVCVAWSHRLLGPTVPLRRHVQALRSGNCRGRLRLRKTDGPFLPLADDLNELTQMLERRHGSGSPPLHGSGSPPLH